MTVTAEIVAADRLTLVPVRVAHAGEMARVLSDPDLYGFIGGSPPTAPELRARYERWIAGSPDPTVSWCNWVIQLHQPRLLVGTVQATISVDGDQLAAEVAWVVGKRWQGQGFATEAARALVGWLRRQSVDPVVAHIHPRHVASAAIATAAGLTPTEKWHDGERIWQLTGRSEAPSPRRRRDR